MASDLLLVVHDGGHAAAAAPVSVQHLERVDHAGESVDSDDERRRSSASGSDRDATATSRACASTSSPRTPASTSATCGPAPARCSRARPSPAKRPAGWQQVNFATPVAIAANTTYVASYHTDTGHYAATGGYFATRRRQRAAACAARRRRRPNGVYRYGAASTLPRPDVSRRQLLGRRGVHDRPRPRHDAADRGERRRRPAARRASATHGYVTATFNETLAPATVNATTFQLRDRGGCAGRRPSCVIRRRDAERRSLTRRRRSLVLDDLHRDREGRTRPA